MCQEIEVKATQWVDDNIPTNRTASDKHARVCAHTGFIEGARWGVEKGRVYTSVIECHPVVDDLDLQYSYYGVDPAEECSVPRYSVQVKIRSWYPGWLVGWIMRYAIWKERRKNVGV